ncbi:hypothetical protein [Mucilaginibacter lacusdianchii]|nr:hypothetical protein [Mucilaginibacter sp. JXJ CY 39]
MLQVPESGTYQLSVNAVGYQLKIIKVPAFTDKDKPVADLGKIALQAVSN